MQSGARPVTIPPMKSIVIMFLGLAICGITLYLMFQGEVGGFRETKWAWITGGVTILVGALINHWEHTRRD